VVLFDPWWNPAVEAQAIDRTHRIGQMKNVTAYRLIAKDTVEEKIRQLQRHKSTLSNAVLGDEGFANALTLSELRQIFAE
jgi:SNF2 family DNA or RNA helicase